MPTSNSTDWTLNRDQVIKAALRKLSVLPSGGSPSTNQTNDAVDALNSIVKALHADGMPLWKINSKDFTVTNGTSSYTIGPSGMTITGPTPLRILQAFYTLSGSNNTPMNIYNRYDFNILPTTNASGTPVSLYYQQNTDTQGTIKLWPAPNDSTTVITINYHSPYEDMDSASDNFDFPSYWIQALTYMLAWSLSPEYGIPPTDRGLLQKEAEYWHQYALSFGTEEPASLYVMPDWTNVR